MQRYRVSFDTAEKAASPSHDCGIWHVFTTEDKVKETCENLIRLGFTPEVTIE